MRKWQPYSDARRQDIWLDVSNAVPTQYGTYRNAPGFLGGGSQVAGQTTLSAWQGALPSGSLTKVAGTTAGGGSATDSKLYTWSGTTFTDRSLAGDYTDSATYWSFAQYGIYTLASNGVDAIQVRDATGVAAFANLGGTPPSTAKYLVVQSNAVLAFNTNSGGQYWAASDIGNHANWTTGEAASGPINHRPGAITAAAAFRDEVIVFKEDSCYRMRYVGSPVFWIVDLISDKYGAMGPGSVAVCGDFIAVCDYKNGAYAFDGSGFRRLDEGIKSFLIASANTPIAAQYFRNQETILWNVPTAAFLVYNVRADAWGKFTAQQPDSDSNTPTHVLMTGNGIYDCMRGVTLIQTDNNDPVLTSFQEDEAAGSNNTALDGYVTTSLFGQHGAVTFIDRLTPALKTPDSIVATTNVPAATALTCTPYYQSNPEGTATSRSAVSCSTAGEKRFDVSGTGSSAPWQKFKITFTNTPWEIDDVIVSSKVSGVAP